MSPSPVERFSALLARSGERGWTPEDDADEGDAFHGGELDDDPFDADERDGDECDGDIDPAGGARPVLSRTLVLVLLGIVLTAALLLLLAPSLLRGPAPLTAEDTGAASGEAGGHGERGGDSASGERADGSGETQSTGDAPAGTDAAAQGADPSGPDAGTGTAPVVVHVVGAVVQPGIVELPAGSRVADALTAAGGAADDARTDAVNLARPVVDGEQIRVPRAGEEDPPVGQDSAPGAGGMPGPGAEGTAPDAAPAALIDLNTADATQLQTLRGIGPVTAQAIIDHRTAIGRFGSVDELLDVTGIGDATLAAIRDSVTVG